MSSLPFKKVITIPPKMVLEMAMGLREPPEIAEEYGFSPEQWEALKLHDPFVKQVDDKREELKAGGWVFRAKCSLIAEELLESLYLKATEENASLHTVLESLKFTSKAAGLDAPKQEAAAAGSGFSINITIGGQSVKVSGVHQPTLVEDEPGNTYDMDTEEHFDFAQSFEPYEPVPLPI